MAATAQLTPAQLETLDQLTRDGIVHMGQVLTSTVVSLAKLGLVDIRWTKCLTTAWDPKTLTYRAVVAVTYWEARRCP